MDRLIVEEKLESLRRCLARIKQKCPPTVNALMDDIDAQDIITLNLTRAVQLCADIAAHLVAEMDDVRLPDSTGGLFDALAKEKVLSDAVARRMRKAVGFRNLAVHQYEEVDWHIVHVICQQRLDDFYEFARAVTDWLDQGRSRVTAD